MKRKAMGSIPRDDISFLLCVFGVNVLPVLDTNGNVLPTNEHAIGKFYYCIYNTKISGCDYFSKIYLKYSDMI
jgi:hypothetical protein